MKIDRRNKARKNATGILAGLIVLTLAFIFGNSIKSQEVSSTESKVVLSYVEPVAEIVVGSNNVTEHLIRKFAHVSEYCALGCEFALFCVLRRRTRIQSAINIMFVGLCTAVADESLQILSGRGPLVEDILLDFVSFFIGMSLVLSFRALGRYITESKAGVSKTQD